MSDEPVVVAIDPGLCKAGLAVVRRTGEVLVKQIVPRNRLCEAALELIEQYQPQAVVIGDRTGSRAAKAEMEIHIRRPMVLVEEHETTRYARERYQREHPRRGLLRLVPSGLFTPPVPLDDYAAVILAERYWDRKASKS